MEVNGMISNAEATAIEAVDRIFNERRQKGL